MDNLHILAWCLVRGSQILVNCVAQGQKAAMALGQDSESLLLYPPGEGYLP